jgi:translocation and assembly module TamB
MSTALTPDFEEPEPGPRKPEIRNPEIKGHRGWKMLGWTIAVLVCLIAAALIVAGALINTDGVHRAILDVAEKQASQSLGVRVRLQNFVVHWPALSLDIYGITADGSTAHPNPPLLQLQHLEVGLRVESVLHHKWYLDTVKLDRPIVWIYVDQNGVSNLPVFNRSKESGNNNTLFDLGIRHAVLEGGDVYYNNRASVLAGDLKDLDLQVSYNASQQMYSGNVAYMDGHLQYGTYRPILHDLDAAFDLTPSTFDLKQAKLATGKSQLLLSATANNYQKSPAVDAQYQFAVDGGQMAHLFNQPSLPSGIVRASGKIHFQEAPDRPALSSIVVIGDLTSDKLEVRTSGAMVDVANLSTHYNLSDGNATLRDLRAELLGGELTAQGSMVDLGGNSRSKFSATVRDVSLSQLIRATGKSGAPGVDLAGTLNASATGTWGRTMDNLTATADTSIHADVSSLQQRRPPPGTNANLLDVSNPDSLSAPAVEALPVESEMHATYTKANGRMEVTNSYLRTAHTDLRLNGAISGHSSLVIQLQANDLRELATIANSFQSSTQNPKPLHLSGAASFQGNVQGSTFAPHITGQVLATNLQVNESAWKLLRSGLDAGPDHVMLENAELQPATRGSIVLSARAGLDKWTFNKNTSPIQAQIRASQIDLRDLAKFVSQPVPVTGTLNSNVSMRGTAMNPQGSGNVSLTEVTAYQQPIHSVRVDFAGNGDQAHADLAIQSIAGNINAKLTVSPRKRTYDAQLTSPGIHLDRLEALEARKIKAAGLLTLNANGHGSFDDPQLSAAIQVPELVMSDLKSTGVDLKLNVANHLAIATLSSSQMKSSIQAKGTVQLTGEYMADASLDTSVIDVQPLLAIYSPDETQDIGGQVQMRATMHGPLKNMKALEAHVTVPVLKMSYQNSIQLSAASPIQVNYQNGEIDIPRATIRGTDTDIDFQAHVPMENTTPMSLQLRGAVDLKLVQLLNPDIRSSGQIRLNIDSHGMAAKGNDIGGEIDIVNANFSNADLPVGLENGNGVLKLTTDRVNIQSFEGKVGGGTVAIQGGVVYRPNFAFDLGLAAKGVRMLYPTGMRETVDANIRLGGTAPQAVLGGTIDLTDLSFTPAFDLSSFAGQFSGGAVPPPSGGMAQNINLNLAVHSSNNVSLASRELTMNGSANLQVRGTAADPVILGRVNLTGGDIILKGNRYVLTGGTVQFFNPERTEPVVNLMITTTIQKYDITLRFQGPVEQMTSEYSSNPALPQADIIHLLAFGSTTEAAANDATPATQQAESLVASEVSSQVTGRISKVAGISELSVSPVLQGGTQQGPPGAEITIRQRVTGNLYITFSTNVATTQDEVIQGQYQLTPRVALSGTREPNGGFGIDALIKHTW